MLVMVSRSSVARQQIGKTNYKQALQEGLDELAAINLLLDRLLENHITAEDRVKSLAKISVACAVINRLLLDLAEFGDQAKEALEAMRK